MVIDDKVTDTHETNNSFRHNLAKYLAHFKVTDYDKKEVSFEEWDELRNKLEWHESI